MVDHFAKCVNFAAEAALDACPRELRGPPLDLAGSAQSWRHKADHVTQSAFTSRRLIATGGIRVSNEGNSSAMNFFAPGPHSSIDTPMRRPPRNGLEGIF